MGRYPPVPAGATLSGKLEAHSSFPIFSVARQRVLAVYAVAGQCRDSSLMGHVLPGRWGNVATESARNGGRVRRMPWRDCPAGVQSSMNTLLAAQSVPSLSALLVSRAKRAAQRYRRAGELLRLAVRAGVGAALDEPRIQPVVPANLVILYTQPLYTTSRKAHRGSSTDAIR